MWSPCRQHVRYSSDGTKQTHTYKNPTQWNIIEVFSFVSAMASAVDGTGDGWMKCFVCKVQAQYGFGRKIYGQQFSASGLDAKRSAIDATSKRVYEAKISSSMCECVYECVKERPFFD